MLKVSNYAANIILGRCNYEKKIFFNLLGCYVCTWWLCRACKIWCLNNLQGSPELFPVLPAVYLKIINSIRTVKININKGYKFFRDIALFYYRNIISNSV